MLHEMVGVNKTGSAYHFHQIYYPIQTLCLFWGFACFQNFNDGGNLAGIEIQAAFPALGSCTHKKRQHIITDPPFELPCVARFWSISSLVLSMPASWGLFLQSSLIRILLSVFRLIHKLQHLDHSHHIYDLVQLFFAGTVAETADII